MEISKELCQQVIGYILVFLLGMLVIYGYYQYRELKKNKEYSDTLRDVVNDYILNGEIKTKEFGRLFRSMCQMANYMGIYRQEVFRLMHELQENGKLDFLDAETEPKKLFNQILISNRISSKNQKLT
ncbi:MAG: hypothetical protein Q8784_02250 [Vigna little leaf phytoplasma]|nr:hypothetical protein [Vigna little leaf phytoplasma]